MVDIDEAQFLGDLWYSCCKATNHDEKTVIGHSKEIFWGDLVSLDKKQTNPSPLLECALIFQIAE